MAKEAYLHYGTFVSVSVKRDLILWQKRPVNISMVPTCVFVYACILFVAEANVQTVTELVFVFVYIHAYIHTFFVFVYIRFSYLYTYIHTYIRRNWFSYL